MSSWHFNLLIVALLLGPAAALRAQPSSELPASGEEALKVANEATPAADLASEANDAAKGAADGDAPLTKRSEKSWLDEMLHTGALGYMVEGGFFMWPILFSGILAAGVIVERYRSLKMLGTDAEALKRQVLELLQDDRVEEALELCDLQQGPVPAILSAGLRKFLVLRRLNYDPGKIEEQVVKTMDDYGVHIVAALERHLPILATVSSVAPMLGFLGTVQGMVISFKDIVAHMGETNIVESAASGIQIALLTTVLGLVVGIPAFTAYNYFTSVINRFVLSVEESATELIEAVTLQLALRRQDIGEPAAQA
jgi:biopolymer transport protein ExbB